MKITGPLVCVVDDDAAIRDSLSMLLGSAGFAVETYASATEFLESYDSEARACLVADIRMPVMNGLELQHELNARAAAIPIVFITGHGDVSMAVKAIQDGAFDFLQKPFGDQDLIDRIHRALDREAHAHEERVRVQGVRRRLASLTRREREVLDKVVDGCANKVIAMDLGVSQRTVELHRARVMQKMGVRSLAELVRQVAAVASP